jgi:site-specific DNA-methyltransferase (adenine-specific)
VKSYCPEGGLVLDNCMGSGTTAVACINTNRNYIGFEIEEKYCKIANIRINELNNEIKLF